MSSKPHGPGALGQATSSLRGGEQAQGVRGEKVQTQRVTEVSVCGGGTGVPPCVQGMEEWVAIPQTPKEGRAWAEATRGGDKGRRGGEGLLEVGV